MKRLIMLGAPGAGKGTQSKLLSERYQIPGISTGDILRSAIEQRTELGNKAQSFIQHGELVPDDVMIGLIRQRLTARDCDEGFILDGFPRTVAQAVALDEYLKQLNKAINVVIVLDVPEREIVTRLTARRICRNCGKDYNIITNPPPGDNLCEICMSEIVQRADDTEATVKKRLKVYQEKTMPLKQYFKQQGKLKIFKANGTIAEIQDRIRHFLDKEIR